VQDPGREIDTLREQLSTGERAAMLDTLEELDTNPEAAADLVRAALERGHDGSSP